MLQRDLERIARHLQSEFFALLRAASVEELAELLPAVRKLLRDGERRAAPPPPLSRPRPRPPAPAPAAAPRRPAVDAYADAVVNLVSSHPGGMRSEEIQSAVMLGTRELRVVLAELVSSGRVARRGQARGTRYALPSDTTDTPDRSPPVLLEAIDAMRAHLANSVMPMTIGDLESASHLARADVKAIVDQLLTLGLAVREGQGPGSRYRLAAQAAPAVRASEDRSGPPRVVRRAPRAKGWQPAARADHSDVETDAAGPQNDAIETPHESGPDLDVH